MSPFAPRVLINGLDYRQNLHTMLAGDISTAKSVKGDVPVFILGRGITTIAEVIDERIELSSAIHREGDTEWIDCDGLYTYAMNPETFRMEITEITKLIRHKSPVKLYRLRTEMGRILDGCTKDHSFLVLSGGELVEKPIEIGDHVPVPRRLPLIEELREITLDYADRFPRATKIPPIKLDYLTGYAAGAFLAQGSPSNGSVQWSTSNEEARRKIAAWLREMSLTHSETKTMIYASSMWLREWFEETCYSGVATKRGKGSGAYRKKVPDYAFSAPREFREGMVDGYSLDGHLRKGWHDKYKEWDIKSASYQLHNGISMLLATLGTFSKLSQSSVVYKGERRTYSALMIPKEDLSKDYWDVVPHGTKLIYPYAKKLGWGRRDSENRGWMATLRTRMKQGNTFRKQFVDDIAKIEAEGEVLPRSIKRFENPDVVWDKVVEIIEIPGGEYVYDFSTRHENFIAGHGALITHNSKILKIAKMIAPRMLVVDETTKPTFEGVAPKRSGDNIEEGIIDWARDGLMIVEELTAPFAKMPLFRRVMDGEYIQIFKKGSSKGMYPNTTMLTACNPEEDFFQAEINLRKQLPFKEGVLSRFDCLIPFTATQLHNELVAEKLYLFGTKMEKPIDFDDIKERLMTLSIGMKRIKKVSITDAQRQALVEAFLEHNDRDKRTQGGLLKNRPLVILRDLETLARFVNIITTVNFTKREINEGTLRAEDADIEKAIQLWENLLQFRIQLYARQSRILMTVSDEMLAWLAQQDGTRSWISIEDLYREFVDIRGTIRRSTFYKEINSLKEAGRIIVQGERNRELKLVVRG